jgi:hypothetical protein
LVNIFQVVKADRAIVELLANVLLSNVVRFARFLCLPRFGFVRSRPFLCRT